MTITKNVKKSFLTTKDELALPIPTTPAEIDPFDPRHWDIEPQDDIDDNKPINFEEIEDEINAKIAQLEEENPLPGDYAELCLGGPVEPQYPKTTWNGILIVGKAPGDAEVAHGLPFTGKSGRLLDRILERNNIERQECLITNAFRMQPIWTTDPEGRRIQNDISHFFTADPSLGNMRLPPYNDRYVLRGPDEHIRDLWKLIKRHKPALIIALGSIALWAITGDGTLQDRMGAKLEHECSKDPLYASYHPAYALHKKDEAIAALISNHISVATREISLKIPQSIPTP